MSALGSAVLLLEVEGWVVLFSQTILRSDFITPETLTTYHFCNDQKTGLEGSFSHPALTVVVVLHTELLTLSPCVVWSSTEGPNPCLAPLAWDSCAHPLVQVMLQSPTPAGAAVTLKDAVAV